MTNSNMRILRASRSMMCASMVSLQAQVEDRDFVDLAQAVQARSQIRCSARIGFQGRS